MRHLRKVTLPITLLLACLLLPEAQAHEFWLEPSSYTPAPDTKITVSHNYGQKFKGDGLPFVTEWHPRYVVIDGGQERKVTGFDGDLPAVQIKFDTPGLKVFGYFGAPEPQSFEDLAEFEKFVRKAGLDHIVQRHRALGKPETDIVESYARNAKLLLGVGNASGADRVLGLPIELIAERNPYELAAGAALPVRLLYRGKPIAGITITTFGQADPKHPVPSVTGADGRAQIALPARGAYLLSAIHMFEPARDSKAHWESLWASLTFAVR